MADRTKTIKLVLVGVAGLSVVAVIWIFYQFRQNQNALNVPIAPKAATQAIMALSQVRQTATKNGTVQWQLDAAAAELEAGTGRMVLQSPRVDFFLEDGTQVHLTAREGVLNTRSNDIEVRGNVKVQNDSYTLVTEVLAYEHAERVLLADAPVQISGRAVNLKAAKMRYDLTTNQTHFDGQVIGLLYENPAI